MEQVNPVRFLITMLALAFCILQTMAAPWVHGDTQTNFQSTATEDLMLIVLADPRPARLRDKVQRSRYAGPISYDKDPTLHR